MKEIKARPDPHPSTDNPEDDPDVLEKKRVAELREKNMLPPDLSHLRKESSLLKDDQWEASHGGFAQKHKKHSHASAKSTHH